MTFTEQIRAFFADRPAIAPNRIAKEMGMNTPAAFRPLEEGYEIPPKWWFPLVKILTAYGLEIDGWSFKETNPYLVTATKEFSSQFETWRESIDLTASEFPAWFRETIEGQPATRPVPRAPTAKEIREAEQQVKVERANGVAVESE